MLNPFPIAISKRPPDDLPDSEQRAPRVDLRPLRPRRSRPQRRAGRAILLQLRDRQEPHWAEALRHHRLEQVRFTVESQLAR